jgi:hypothetical protein
MRRQELNLLRMCIDMEDEYQPIKELMKSKRAGHTNPEGDFASFLKNTGGTPSLDALDDKKDEEEQTDGPDLPSLEPLDGKENGAPSGSAESAAHAKPESGPDTN